MELGVHDQDGCYVDLVALSEPDLPVAELPRPDLANLDAYFRVGIEHDPDSIEMLAISDYHGYYTERLARRHLARPLPPDRRLWSEADVARVDRPISANDAPPAPMRLAAG